ncbi:hypothetical protein X772_36385 [Mesorhizobium sp. LSJC280B00]|nr:hypothetical protein X772_36385 [Mesorhizobium sp. LSJC280B00]
MNRKLALKPLEPTFGVDPIRLRVLVGIVGSAAGKQILDDTDRLELFLQNGNSLFGAGPATHKHI